MEHVALAVSDSYRQIARSPTTYSLGALTCLIAVAVAAMMHSMLDQAPAIYLSTAELEEGQIDVLVKPSDPNTQVLSYSRAAARLTASTAANLGFHTPRYAQTASIRRAGMTQGKSTKVSFVALDSNREYAAGVGRGWDLVQYPPLAFGEAYLDEKVAAVARVSVGDTFDLAVDVDKIFRTLNAPPTENLTRYFTRYNNGLFQGCQRGGCRCIRKINTGEMNEKCMFCGVDDGSACGFPARAKLTLNLKKTVKDWEGKMRGEVLDGAVVEYKHFFRMLYNAQPLVVRQQLFPTLAARGVPGLRGDFELSTNQMDEEFATEIIVMIPPNDRAGMLIQPDYNTIQSDMVKYSSNVVTALGILDSLQYETPIVRQLRRSRFTSMYLALILDILVLILTVLSTVLIYSLLMINVQTRTFEIAIRRMLGTSKRHIVLLLGVQALSYSIPALVVGMTVSHFGAVALIKLFSERMSGITIEGGLSARGVLYGIILGLLIPICASIGPINIALKKRLVQALETKRPALAVSFKISRNDNGKINKPSIVVGFCLALFGFIIYYFLPLALLSFNVTLLGSIFLFILLGLLFGLALLSLNVERSVEFGVMEVFFRCCVKSHTRTIALKNLVAHRERNLKTSMMYAIALSFIILVNVFAFIELQSFQYYLRQSRGSGLVIFGRASSDFSIESGRVLRHKDASAFMGVIENDTYVKDRIYGTAWSTKPVRSRSRSMLNSICNQGRQFCRQDANIVSVSPNYLEIAEPSFVRPYESWRWAGKFLSSLSPEEQVYGTRGSQTVILPSAYAKELRIDTAIEEDRENPNPIEVQLSFSNDEAQNASPPSFSRRFLLTPQHMYSNIPGLRFSEYQAGRANAIVSLPMYMKMLQGLIQSIENVPLDRILIRLKPGLSIDEVDKVAKTIAGAIAKNDIQGYVFNMNDRLSRLEDTAATINIVFLAMTIVGMTLCFFSLLASMVSNISEQTKDMAILRALGLRKRTIILIFCMEAFVLVLAASFLGSMAGWFVSWTMSQQRTLITNIPLAFYFPTEVTLLMIFLAAVMAIFSSAFPAQYYMYRKYIAQLFRI